MSRKRKSSTLGSKSKRLRLDSEDLIELKLTWEEAQGLLRPPSNVPSIVVIEGFEFEEYEVSWSIFVYYSYQIWILSDNSSFRFFASSPLVSYGLL